MLLCGAITDMMRTGTNMGPASSSATYRAPILAYKARGPVNQLQWSMARPDWVAISFGRAIQTFGSDGSWPLSVTRRLPCARCAPPRVPDGRRDVAFDVMCTA